MKMTKIKGLSLVKLFLIGVFLVCVVGLAVTSAGGTARADMQYDTTIESSYSLNQEITLPNATINVGGHDYPAERILTYPSGLTSSSQTVKLDEAGVYKVTYTVYSGKYYVETKSFSVLQNNVTISGEGNISYGKLQDSDLDIDGLTATLNNGDTLNFNQVIDLRNASRKDSLFKCIAIPESFGAEAYTKIIVTLTDVYDLSKYVVAEIKQSPSSDASHRQIYTYVTVRGTGQPAVGLESRPNDGTIIFENQRYGIHVNDVYGRAIDFSFTGSGNKAYGQDWIGISYDTATNAVFMVCDGYENTPVVIADLDSSEMFVGSIFNGFPSGKVKMSIQLTGYVKTAGSLFFSEILGEVPSQDNSVLNDVNNPSLEVELKDYDAQSDMKFRVGESFKIFSAQSFDEEDGVLTPSVNVYYDYNNAKINVPVDENNMTFLPSRVGNYTIEYSVRDKSGNKTQKTVDVFCDEFDKLSLNVVGYKNSLIAGVEQELFDSFTYENNSFDASLIVEVSLTTNKDVKYTLNVENGYKFTPVFAGSYKATFYLTDYATTVWQEKTFSVTTADGATFKTEPVMPEYFIKNCLASLPIVNVYEFTSSATNEKQAKIYYKQDGGSETEYTSPFTVTASDNVEIIYRSPNGRTEKTYSVKVVNVGYGTSSFSIAKYFKSEKGNISYEAFGNRISFTVDGANAVDGRAEMKFVNALSFAKFSIDVGSYFKESSGVGNSFDKLHFIMTDFADKSVSLDVCLERMGNTSALYVNGKRYKDVQINFNSPDSFVNVSYEDDSKTFIIGENKILIDSDSQGNAFDGFYQYKGYLTIAFEGVKDYGLAGIDVKSINLQAIDKRREDDTRPRFVSIKTAKGEKKMGEVITVYGTYAYDVLSPYVELTITAKTPSGSYITANDGTVLDGSQDPTLDYTFTIAEHGEYTLTYSADDTNKTTPTTLKITVVNFTPPTIVLLNNVYSCKVGETVNVSYRVENAISGVRNQFVTVRRPDSVLEYLSGNSFTPTQRGNYVVTVCVIDNDFNMSEKQYTVWVE